MKKSITYREITVAIGIVVAMVIVLTLWIWTPGEPVSRSQPSHGLNLNFSAKKILQHTTDFFLNPR